jgi:hypothetical protein
VYAGGAVASFLREKMQCGSKKKSRRPTQRTRGRVPCERCAVDVYGATGSVYGAKAAVYVALAGVYGALAGVCADRADV